MTVRPDREQSNAGHQNHGQAFLEYGKIKCRSANDCSQLSVGDVRSRCDGLNEIGDKLPFIDLGSVEKAVQSMADRDGTCALFDNGAVKCWGNNDCGNFPYAMSDILPCVKLQ